MPKRKEDTYGSVEMPIRKTEGGKYGMQMEHVPAKVMSPYSTEENKEEESKENRSKMRKILKGSGAL